MYLLIWDVKMLHNYHIAGTFDGEKFDGYWLLKYSTENILMDGFTVFY